MPVSFQRCAVHKDRACRDAQAPEITDELESGGVDVTPVDHLRRVPDPGDPGVVDDAESGTVTYDGASEVARDGVSGFLVLEDDCTLAAGITAATLLAVACPAPGMCAATGETGLLAGNSHALVETLPGSNWTPVKVALPPGATVTAGARLSGVACPAVGTCVAAGFYTGPDGVLGLGGGASAGRCPGCLATR